MKITFVPSLLKVAECQYAKPVSVTTSSLLGLYGSVISKRIPFPEHAPAAIFKDGKTVISWHWSVLFVSWVSSPWSPPVQSPPKAPVSGSANTVGLLTILDKDGSAIGISITSILNNAVLLSPGMLPMHCSNSSSSLTPAVPELYTIILLSSVGPATTEWVWEPLQVWTAPTWTGLVLSEISKILIPRNLSELASFPTPIEPQSILLLFCSTDIINILPTIDTSPWPPGQTTDDTSEGIPSFLIS